MATVESVELGIVADGRDVWYMVTFTDDSDTSIMENGTGITLTGSVTGSLTASPIGRPRVEIRGGKAVVSGWCRIDNGDFFPWYNWTHETIEASSDAGGLFASETTETQSGAFTGVAVENRSRVGLDGKLCHNVRRTRFVGGDVAEDFVNTPLFEFDADLEEGDDLDTIALTDQVSGQTTHCDNPLTSTNAFSFRKDYYGPGRNAIEFTVSNDGIRLPAAFDGTGGFYYHIVVDASWVSDSASRFVEFVGNGTGLTLHGQDGHIYSRVPVSTGATTSRERDSLVYATIKDVPVVMTFVHYPNGDRRMFVNGRSYNAANYTAPTGSMTNTILMRRNSGTGTARMRWAAFFLGTPTDQDVYTDHDYIANAKYGSDEDLCGIPACFVDPVSGSSVGTGRFHDPIDAITPATIRTGSRSWLSVSSPNTGHRRDVAVLLANGTTVPIDPGINFNGSNDDPHFPTCLLGAASPVSPESPIPVADYQDQGSDSGQVIFQVGGDGQNEVGIYCTEVTSLSRTYRDGGTATFANEEDEEVTLFRCMYNLRGLQILGSPVSQLSHAVVDVTTGEDIPKDSFDGYDQWMSPFRNSYTKQSTQSTSGSQEAAALFLSYRQKVWIKDVAGYECGWDPDVKLSSASINLWGGSSFNGDATDRPALDNGYSRFGYLSSTYGPVLVENFINVRDSSHDLQFRAGGQVRTFARWESAGPTFARRNDSYFSKMYSEGIRSILGSNLTGYRGAHFSSSGEDSSETTTASRLSVWEQVIIHDGNDANSFAAFDAYSGRTNKSSSEPDGTAELRLDRFTIFGSNRGVRLVGTGGALKGYLKRSIIDLSGRTSSDHVLECDHNGDLSEFEISQFGYDRNDVSEGAAAEYGGSSVSLDSLFSTLGNPVSLTLDRTDDGWNIDSSKTLKTWCLTVHEFTKEDENQTDAEELGEQLYEAFADAVRTGQSPYAYSAAAFWDWVLDQHGWSYDEAADAAVDAIDPGEYWGAIEPNIDGSAPTVSSPTSDSVTSSTAVLGGDVTDDGGEIITERGVVYSLTSVNNDPEIGGVGVTKVSTGGTTGVFTVAVSDLVAESEYTFKAYAINSEGIGYSSADTFTTLEIPVDPATLSVTDSSDQELTSGGTTVLDDIFIGSDHNYLLNLINEDVGTLIIGTTGFVLGGDASWVTDPLPTGINGLSQVSVVFSLDSSTEGAVTGTLSINSNSEDGIFTHTFVSEVLAPDFSVQDHNDGDTIDFGNVNYNESKVEYISLLNTGSTGVMINIVAGGDVSVGSYPSFINSEDSIDVSVSLKTNSRGSKTGSITIFTNDPEVAEFNLSFIGEVEGGGTYYTRYSNTIDPSKVTKVTASTEKIKSTNGENSIPITTDPTDNLNSKIEDRLLIERDFVITDGQFNSVTVTGVNYEVIKGSGDTAIGDTTTFFFKTPLDTEQDNR